MNEPDNLGRLERIKATPNMSFLRNPHTSWSDQQWLLAEVERLRERDTALTRTNQELRNEIADLREGIIGLAGC